MEGLGLGFMANHFDVVPVRTDDESSIVVRVVLRAQTRRTVVFAPSLKSRAMEVFDLLAILGYERQVEMCCLLFDPADAQRRLAAWAAELDAERTLRDNSYTERLECFEEERLALCVVADPEYDVIKHGSLDLWFRARPNDQVERRAATTPAEKKTLIGASART
jgi:hypothetical protein